MALLRGLLVASHLLPAQDGDTGQCFTGNRVALPLVFHVLPYSETMKASSRAVMAGARGPHRGTQAAPTAGEARSPRPLAPFDVGFLLGVLVGEGHFGGDGRQPHVTLRMHAEHSALFEWLIERFPDSRLYGPYDHSGRHYYQWMARGRFLREQLMPLLRAHLRPEHSARVWDRYVAMCRDYHLGLPEGVPTEGTVSDAASAGPAPAR